MELKYFLWQNEACEPAVDWLDEVGGINDPQSAWDACSRGDWMMWWLQEEGSADLRTMTAIKAEQVEQVRHLLTDPRSIAAIDAAHAFGRGQITEQELTYAATNARAAYAYACAASATAAYPKAAAYAIATSAATAATAADAATAAYATATATAYAASLSKSADIVRRFVPAIPLNFKQRL